MSISTYNKIKLFLFQLKIVNDYEYTPNEENYHELYYFKDINEYNQYFLDCGVDLTFNEKLLGIPVFSYQNDGSIIAYKVLCDQIIKNCCDEKEFIKRLIRQ